MIRLRMTEMADEESLPVQCRVPFASRLLPIMGIDPGLSFNAVINFISVVTLGEGVTLEACLLTWQV
ncbi:hypothetical protein D0Y65_015428 [Glycine soja]|uniref:Uncharacterized protein n=1 Tax=Glycine soja TaxID=3848 RepID=A0A445KDB6_GLYSO|nr:hypothetical protein D0Y65_015428 [Glycine soja]